LINGVTYWYYITAVNAVGEGAASNEVSAVPMTQASSPTDLQAIAGLDDIGLSWSPPASTGGSVITNYEIYRGVTSGNESPLITMGNATTYLDPTVESGVSYYYYVTAVNGAGESVASNEASSVIVIPPSSPLSLMAMASDRSVSLTWSAPSLDGGSAVTGYEVHRGNASGGETYLTTVSGTNYTDTGLENGTELFYVVKAVNTAGTGSASNEVSAIPAAVPSAPYDLQASAGPSSITLTWTAPTDDGGSPVIGYMVYRNEESGGEELLATIGAVTIYQDDTAQVGQEYWYYVRAVNALGEGPASNEATTIILLVPSAPLGLQAVAGDTMVFLSWTSPSEDGGTVITGYEIFRGNVSGEETYLTTVTSTNHTDGEVQNGVTYFYYVVAMNSEGAGVASNEITAMPMAVPSNDSVLIAVAGDSQIELAWTAPSDEGGVPILSYVIYRGTEEGSEEFLVGTGDVLSFIDAGLSNGQTYWYYVTAVNQAGEGPASNEISATPSSVPGAPRSMQALAGASVITLTWLAPENDGGSQITNYQVYRGMPGEEVLLSTVGSVLTYADSAVEVGQEYWYSVVAVNSAGAGAMSESASAIILGTPSAPLGLEAIRGQDFAVLTWEAPMDDGGSPIVLYSIYRGTESGGEELLVHVGDVLSFMDIEVSAGSTYWYYVTANNSAGEGEVSSEASVSLQSVASAPSDLVAVPGDGIVLLNWTTPSDDGGVPITGYKVFRVNESGEAVLVASVTSAGYTDEGLINGEAYAYFVVATNTIGDGAPSEPVITTPQAPEEDQFDWVLWLHIILLIVALVLLTYYYVKRKKEEDEGSEKEGGEKVQ
ncbi:MAG: fibronectin type III domain-containing protein, partial [Methanomassiliicoccales archaeon]|nr:fibronectin type III domain-containing protein [Methanomassiliicoccales archaeon]